MADPMSTTVIGTLVSLMISYRQYRATVETATQQGKPEPAKPPEADLGEQALKIVAEGIVIQGNEDEVADLATFVRNPQRYVAMFAGTLHDIAAREPAFAQQLQTLAQQANIQTSGAQGSVDVSGGTVHGPVIGAQIGNINTSPFINVKPPPADTGLEGDSTKGEKP